MIIFVLNCGSSSIKFKLYEMGIRKTLAWGQVERIGQDQTMIRYQSDCHQMSVLEDVRNHEEGVSRILGLLTDPDLGVLTALEQIDRIGHRLSHGGTDFRKATLINDTVKEKIRDSFSLAPLHTPAIYEGIQSLEDKLPDVPAYAVFDNSFHLEMPAEAYMYGLPYRYYQDYGVRRYGFHGPSHQYVSDRAAALLHKPLNSLRMVTCHLGSGSSIAAIRKGISVDCSMGFTPLAGVPMGTRCGDIDPAIPTYLVDRKAVDMEEIVKALNYGSGLLGLSGFSADVRDLEAEVENAGPGAKRAQLALDVLCYSVKKYIGRYAAVMGGLDAVVFTGGIGENSSRCRAGICHGMDFLGIQLDADKNQVTGQETMISSEESTVNVLVIPTDEEWAIASEISRDTTSGVNA